MQARRRRTPSPRQPVTRNRTPKRRARPPRQRETVTSEAHQSSASLLANLPEEERPDPTWSAPVYEKHQELLPGATMSLARHGWSVEQFLETWNNNESRYRRVSARTNMPAELVAAIHFREGSGDFTTYLHNGEPLGRTTTLVPAGIYFEDWEEAAIDALSRFSGLQNDLGLTADDRDLAAIATFAEYYNGLGYHNRGVPSAYVYSGTDVYSQGKYVADGVYSSTTVDQQLGVVAMVLLARGQGDHENLTGDEWELGDRILHLDRSGADVRELQELLLDLGYEVVADGVFGAPTYQAVIQFQLSNGLAADGLVGPLTLAALRRATPQAAQDEQPPAGPTSGTAAWGDQVLRRGSQGAAVRSLQEMLVMFGQSILVDGVFGPGTEQAVRNTQAMLGVQADGIVGPQTTSAMLRGRPESSTPPAPASVRLELEGETIRRGSSGELVRTLQEILGRVGYSLSADGIFGSVTDQAVRAFQREQGLVVDGIVGPRTAEALNQAAR